MEFGLSAILWIVLGAGAGAGLGFVFRAIGFDGDRAAWPLVLIFIAINYISLAAGGGQFFLMILEAALAMPFIALAVLGFMKTRWWVVAGLVLHAVLDAVHPSAIDRPSIPAAYPWACLGFDLALAGWIAWLPGPSRRVTEPAETARR